MDEEITWEAIDNRIRIVIERGNFASQGQVDSHESRLTIVEQSVQAILESMQGLQSSVDGMSDRFGTVETLVNMHAAINKAWDERITRIEGSLSDFRDNLSDEMRSTREEALAAVANVNELHLRLAEDRGQIRRRTEMLEYILKSYVDDLAWARTQRTYQEGVSAVLKTRGGKIAAGGTALGLLLAADAILDTFGITDLLQVMFGGLGS